MPPTIRIDEEVFGALQKLAQPFVDTPNAVLRRLLGLNGHRRSGTAPGKVRPKYAPGAVTRRHAFRIPILDVLVGLSGRAFAADVLARVESQMASRLTALDRQLLPSGGQLRWRKQADFERLAMVREGLLKSDSPRGMWELTDRGSEEARKHQ